MKLGTKESISKLDKFRALFKNHLLVAQDLWSPKATRNSVEVKPAHDSASLSSPSKRVLQVGKMRQTKTVVHCIARHQETERCKAIPIQQFKRMNCDAR